MNLGVVALCSVFPVRLLIVVFVVCPGLFCLVSMLCVGHPVFCVAYGSDSVYALRGKFRYSPISSVARKVVVPPYVVLHSLTRFSDTESNHF